VLLPVCVQAKHQADEEAENVALIETESADLNADFVGEVMQRMG